MRKLLIGLAVMFAVAGARPAEAGWRDVVSPSKNWKRVKSCASSATNKVTTYCSKKVERAKAEQAKSWGLTLPPDLRADRPLVVCVHGLDSTAGVFYALNPLLKEEGFQVGHFSYPSDGPIRASADGLAKEMAALREAYPELRVHVIGHSMGSLVARAYIEGEEYSQPVDRFIAIAPPNHGSPWTRQRWLIEFNEHYHLRKYNKDWSPIWMFTDGHGEGADDLKPGSKFLKELNARPRRAGVSYTIVHGDHHILNRFGANAFDAVKRRVPKQSWWGVRHTVTGLRLAEACLEGRVSGSDGVVPLESAKLEGVSDVVRLHGDHNTLCMGYRGQKPVAWPVIRERLGR